LFVDPGCGQDQVVESTHLLGPSEIDRTGIPSLTGALLENVTSVTINDTEGNVFQPEILFRGFTASPVAGTPEGIAAAELHLVTDPSTASPGTPITIYGGVRVTF